MHTHPHASPIPTHNTCNRNSIIPSPRQIEPVLLTILCSDVTFLWIFKRWEAFVASTCKYNNSSLILSLTIQIIPNWILQDLSVNWDTSFSTWSLVHSDAPWASLTPANWLTYIPCKAATPNSGKPTLRASRSWSFMTDAWHVMSCHLQDNVKKKTGNGNICCSRSAQSVSNTNPYYKLTVETACSWLGLPWSLVLQKIHAKVCCESNCIPLSWAVRRWLRPKTQKHKWKKLFKVRRTTPALKKYSYNMKRLFL